MYLLLYIITAEARFQAWYHEDGRGDLNSWPPTEFRCRLFFWNYIYQGEPFAVVRKEYEGNRK